MIEGPYARLSFLRPHDGHTVDFEAGYIRHLGWHREAKDPWRWFGWTIWSGERQRWLVYATFGHSALALDNPILPAEDERDNVSNVTPHGSFMGHGLYEFLPRLSRGSGEPSPLPRMEMLTVELVAGKEESFEAAIAGEQAELADETLWFRMLAGGVAPRYLRLRPRTNLSVLLEERSAATLPKQANESIAKCVVEILNLRPPMSYRLEESQ